MCAGCTVLTPPDLRWEGFDPDQAGSRSSRAVAAQVVASVVALVLQQHGAP